MSDYALPNNSVDLSGQVALVTGTTSGLGWRFARVLANAGAKVALTGRRTERLDELAELIGAEGGQPDPQLRAAGSPRLAVPRAGEGHRLRRDAERVRLQRQRVVRA